MILMGLIFPAVLAVCRLLLRRQGKKGADRLRRTLGPGLKLLSGCGFVTRTSRVPGVIALSREALAYEAFILGQRETIPLTEIAAFSLEDTRKTRHRRARKYRRASALEIVTRSGQTRLFVLPRSEATAWQTTLPEVLPDP